MMNKIKVLYIASNLLDEVSITQMLDAAGEPGFSVSSSRGLVEGFTVLNENLVDVVLLAMGPPDTDGVGPVAELSRAFPVMPVLVLAAERHEAIAARAIEKGVQDYLIKERLTPDLLSRAIRYAIERKSMLLENGRLVKDLNRLEEEMRQMANRDALTGLPNRRLFLDIMALAREQANRNEKKMGVLVLNLDGFKQVNDTLGRDAGDMLLEAAAARLKSLVRRSDTVARIGGDEFNIILTDIVNAEDIADIAQKIMQSVRRPFLVGDHQLQVTTTIGVSLYPDDDEDIDALLKDADIAMHHAKVLGKNNYSFYDDSINVRSLERVRNESMLRRSLDSGEMLIYYQPLVDISTRQIVCAEALTRWNHPDKGLLFPHDFIPAAIETGFISALDEWVLRAVSAQISSWLKAGLSRVCVSVNLSARQFHDPQLADTVSNIIRETGIPAGSLNLELSESTAMENVELTTARLRELNAVGVHISIDQFGTAYSSLNHLKRLPIERLKIDKSFIRHIPDDPDDRTIVRALTAFGHNMRLKVAADGVETENQLTFLRRTGCDEMQGYLFSKPVPADVFERMLVRKAA